MKTTKRVIARAAAHEPVSCSEQPQNAPSIAVNPFNPMSLVATAYDYSSEEAGIGLYRSKDGGNSFTSALLPLPPGCGATGKAVAASGLENVFLVVGTAFNRPLADGSVIAYRSLDDGETFSDPIVIARGVGTDIFHDNPYVTIDLSTVSPFSGRAYVCYDRFSNHLTSKAIFFQRSTNMGETWSDPMRLSTRGAAVQGSTIATGPAGEVYVAWIHTAPGRPRFLLRRSDDGGVTFGPTITVATVRLVPIRLPVRGWAFRTPTFAYLATDRSGGRYGGGVYAMWQQNRFGSSDIVLTCSSDRGDSWSFYTTVNDSPRKAQDFLPSIVVSPVTGNLKVIYYTNRKSTYHLDVFRAESTTGGISFSRNRRLTATSFDPNAVPFFGTPNAFIDWTDTRKGNQDIVAEKG